MPIASIHPASGKLLRSFEPLDEAAIRAKISVASEAFAAYGEVPLEHRSLWMRRLALILEQDQEELAELIVTEMGKPLVAARQEIQKCAACCRYYAENAASILSEEDIPTDNLHSYVRWDPLGVVLAVMPWNFPFWQVFRFLAPALMGGNVGLLKHASNVPQCALAIEAAVRRAGFPRGSFQTLLIESRQVESVLADDRVVAVTVTGSEAAGRAVGAQAGWLIKKSVLELGGSDPFIVMPTADLDQAVAAGIKARCMNNGQSCIAAKRFIIHDDIYDQFETRFVAGIEALTIGDPMLETTDIGPLATAAGVDDLEKQVKAALAAGAQILTGGERMLGVGNYFEPTVIAGLPRTAPVYRDEIFGPVALLFRARSVAEAIAIANDTPFGLGASAWTRDTAEQERFVHELECGAVFINAMVASDPRLPFGGIKRSGYGRELSAAGMREFLNAKTVVVAPPVQPNKPPAAHSRMQAVRERSREMEVREQQLRGQELRDQPSRNQPAYEEPDEEQRLFGQDEFSRALDDALSDPPPRSKNKLSIL
jgi:succinate-semialdehyde dehydrogenase/glutarate-semialdehyde dehydrogenase